MKNYYSMKKTAEFKRHLFVHGSKPPGCLSTQGPHVVLALLGYHNACLVLDALRGTPLRTDGDPSGFHRTRRDQQIPHKHREARNAQAEGGGGGGGVDISPLPDNMTRIVVRSIYIYIYINHTWTYTQIYASLLQEKRP